MRPGRPLGGYSPPNPSASIPSGKGLTPVGEVKKCETPIDHERSLHGYETDWVVYAKAPFGGPLHVLKYLARYTHRVAISNRRLIDIEDGKVRFRWKDYAIGRVQKTMTLGAEEFIRRFLLHVLPKGFVHIRHYGFLANRHRKEKLARCRELIRSTEDGQPTSGVETAPPSDILADPQAGDHERRGSCPICGTGQMVLIEILKPMPAWRMARQSCVPILGFDTS